MDVIEIQTACHAAYYCPLSGEGRFVLPLPEDDLGPLGAGGLHTADGRHALALLRDLGVEPAEDEEDGGPWWHVGYRPDGREVVALYGFAPIVTMPTVEEQHAASLRLDALAGLVPAQRQREEKRSLDGAP